MSSGNSDNPLQCNNNRNKETDGAALTCGGRQGMHTEDWYLSFHCFTGLFCSHDCWSSIFFFFFSLS